MGGLHRYVAGLVRRFNRRPAFRAVAGYVAGEVVVTTATTPSVPSFGFSSCKYFTAPPTLPSNWQDVDIWQIKTYYKCNDRRENESNQINQPIQCGKKLVPPIANDDSFKRPAARTRPSHFSATATTSSRLTLGH